jgi:hypothetical protein
VAAPGVEAEQPEHRVAAFGGSGNGVKGIPTYALLRGKIIAGGTIQSCLQNSQSQSTLFANPSNARDT